MKTLCPFCEQKYDVEERFNGQVVECSKCKQEFLIEPCVEGQQKIATSQHSPAETSCSEKQSKKAIRVPSSRKKGWIISFAVIIAIFLGCGIAYYFIIPNKMRAINNRVTSQCAGLARAYKIYDPASVKKMCQERVKIEFKEMEKQNLDDVFIAFWCDGNVAHFLKKSSEIFGTKNNKLTAEDRKFFRKFDEYLDVHCPQTKKIMVIQETVDKEYAPLNELILKYGFGRNWDMLELDQKFKDVSNSDLRKRAIDTFTKALYNSFSKDSEIKHPKQLYNFCLKNSVEIYDRIEDVSGEKTASDWAKVILSNKFIDEMKSGLAKDGMTASALYWLEFSGEKMLPPLPYGSCMKKVAKIDRKEFYGKYLNIASEGKEETQED